MTFKEYVLQEYSLEESKEVLRSHDRLEYQIVYQLSINLIIWSLFGVIFNILVGILTARLISIYGNNWEIFLFTLVLLLFNLVCKFFYIKKETKNILPIKIMFMGVIPYLGSGIITAYALKDSPLYASVFKRYFKELTWKGKLGLTFSFIQKNKKKFILIFILIMLIFLLKIYFV